MEVIAQTRFSYVGSGGWKAVESRDPSILFDEDRLNLRFMLFEKVTLPSLAHQGDDDFKLHILSSNLMPKPYQDRLRDICDSTLGKDRVYLRFENPGRPSSRYFRNYVLRHYTENDLVALTVLDDDDGFAKDFVRLCRHSSIKEYHKLKEDQDHVILSFPRGYEFNPGYPPEYQFKVHAERWINLGLTWVANGGTKKNAFMTRHKMVSIKHPVAIQYRQRPLYIRTQHGLNDTRTLDKLKAEQANKANLKDPKKKAKAIADDKIFEENKVVRKRFPYMTQSYLADLQKEFEDLSGKINADWHKHPKMDIDDKPAKAK